MERDEPAYAFSESTLKAILGGPNKRELFAAMAMQAFVGKHVTMPDSANYNVHQLRARWAVKQADALIAELEKGGGA